MRVCIITFFLITCHQQVTSYKKVWNEATIYSSSTTSKKVEEGVPYETVLKDATVKEQQLPQSADVVIIGKPTIC